MPGKLSTIVNNISTIPNNENQALVKEFYELINLLTFREISK